MRRLLLLISAFVSTFSMGQDHHVLGLFPTYNQNGAVSQKLDYSIYSFLAIYPNKQTTEGTAYPAKINAFYIELDAIYKLDSSWSLAGSYTYERANPLRNDFRIENRLWVQAQHLTTLGSVNVKNRLRYDLRFIENRTTKATDFRPRLRYLLGADRALNDKGLYLAAYNEFFFDTFEERIQAYAENWAFAGIGFKLCESTKLETGPLLISWIRDGQKNWLHQYFLQVTAIVQLDLKKD